MASNLINDQLKYFKRKRDLYLFFIFFSLLIFLITYPIMSLLEARFDDIVTVYLVYLLIGTILFVVFKSKFLVHAMYYKYYKMLSDDQGPYKVPIKPFTPSFYTRLQRQGFLDKVEYDDFVIFYQFTKNLQSVRSRRLSFVAVILTTKPDFDFYQQKVNIALDMIYSNYSDRKKVRNQIVLQFRKYDTYSEEARNRADQIINFNETQSALIQINCDLYLNEGEIYHLRPKKVYPNKFYYYATNMIQKLCGVETSESGSKR
ncbi:hypothetical protein JV173_06485 [Acholeplasma equirhinis]|uniref:hypothetical protein n=1 Tax=Acholeplasma equirhinis TaxID=555393 RepID=UPI00197AC19F|nr:hypothetical protein [Acholeplasma equirhinis]MBN3491146.1 hypothetical protein [Acholeplasma equirhinis]